MTRSVSIRPRFARRIPDPNFEKQFGIVHHVMFVSVADLPSGIPNDPNARTPNTNKQVYREVESSLLNLGENVPGTFHLKHKGMTLIAQSVRKSGENYVVDFEVGQGILDGGHTYKIIEDARANPDVTLSNDQYIKLEIRTQVPDDWAAAMAGGLNSSVQVQPMSLANRAGKFDWLKDVLAESKYLGSIAWQEGDPGTYTGRDIIALLTCFNIDLYPNTASGLKHPIAAYERASKALEDYEDNQPAFERMRPIVEDVLDFYETVRSEGPKLWTASGQRRGGSLAFVESRRGQGKCWEFPFIEASAEHRLMKGAAFPMFAAFRWMIELNEGTGQYCWRGGYPAVKRLWQEVGAELMEMTVDTSNDSGRKPDAIGKSRSHWSNLHGKVTVRDLMAQRDQH